jgi:hypothetical protein
VAKHDSSTIIKFDDKTMVVGLITDNNETAYREGGQRPGSVVTGQQPLPQREQDKGAHRGLQERRADHALIHIEEAVRERFKSFKFLDVHITNKLSWSNTRIQL